MGAGAALASSPAPPPPAAPPPASGPTGGGGGGDGSGGGTTTTQPTGGSTTTQAPPADTRAPGRVLGLHAITKTPGQITLRWTNPHASDLAGIVIRRGWSSCPTSPGDGVQIGRTAVRTMQVDRGAVDNTRYCYAAFAFDGHANYSPATLDRSVLNPGDHIAPGPVTGLTVTTDAHGQIVVSWQNPQHADIAFDAVRRGVAPNCPTGPADGSRIGRQSVRTSQVDVAAKPGVTYCYSVFALDASGNASASVTLKDAAPKPAAAHHTTAAQASTSGNGGSMTSMLMRVVAVAGLLMVIVMVVATVMTRRRIHSSAYAHAARGQLAPARQFGPMSASGPGALVIPALAVLGCCAAVALVLLNL